jgi:hypothetical protein
MPGLIRALLEVVTNPFGLSAIGCVFLALFSLGMMVVGVARSNAPRIWSAGLPLGGVAYAAANVGVFAATVSVDAFKIFELAYILSVGLVGPAVMITALVAVARVQKQLGWFSILGFVNWVACVGFAHLWVIAAASASV